ncbi:MAG TPA: hypothetical protein VNM48_16795 [Chloroflexota bacterium]|nr:hypothetical protein [Chloroflexota bacterium]
MTTTELATRGADDIMEAVLAAGDLDKLTPAQRTSYLIQTCESLGLNPLTQPFQYIRLQNRLVLYARKDATDQLRNIHHVTIEIVGRDRIEDVYVVTARAMLPDGRKDEEIGAVPIQNLKGDALANALMKATTKAKRRVTLSICGLGLLDESELETIPGPHREPVAQGEWTRPAEVVRHPLPAPVDDVPAEIVADMNALRGIWNRWYALVAEAEALNLQQIPRLTDDAPDEFIIAKGIELKARVMAERAALAGAR